KGRTELCSLLKKNLDIFAWQPSDMTGVPWSVVEHRLDLKQHLSALPLLAAPKPREELIMYSSATHGAISAVLMTERGTTQTPVYFISRALQGPELNYSPMEKLVLSLVFAAKRLRRYFQAHPITGQILADFLNEMPSNASQGASVAETQEEPWTLFTNGSSCVDGSGAWLILTNPDGVEFTYALRFQFAASNNEAEYEALIAGAYLAKEDNMIKYLEITKALVSGFKTFLISQVPRSRNKKADALSKIASTSFAHLSEQGILPGDEKEARKLRLKARQYELMEGVLYKRSFLTPWLRCVGPLQAEYVMKEIHEGSCSMHAGPVTVRPLSGRAGESKVPDSRNGLLHEVNKSKSSGNDYRQTSEEIRMGQYCMPLWYTRRNNLRQRDWNAHIPHYSGRRVNNDEELRLNLDLLEERQELAAMSEARSKSKMIKYYNSRVRGVAFKPGDFVYRSNDASHAS
nr:reverse transcriptase domain-containing protein [Tanacetum cinerariifolium]